MTEEEKTYCEMRTSHLSESEKSQLLHYIDDDENNVRNIEFWLCQIERETGIIEE